jgi:hypothetical protein
VSANERVWCARITAAAPAGRRGWMETRRRRATQGWQATLHQPACAPDNCALFTREAEAVASCPSCTFLLENRNFGPWKRCDHKSQINVSKPHVLPAALSLVRVAQRHWGRIRLVGPGIGFPLETSSTTPAQEYTTPSSPSQTTSPDSLLRSSVSATLSCLNMESIKAVFFGPDPQAQV